MEKIGIYMKKVKFNESQIQYIIKESMEPNYIGTIDDIDGEIPQEDDWRSDEPSQGYVQSTFETIEQQCNACGAIFKNMGDNEFGVIIKDMGSANELVDSLKNMEESGIIYNTGGNLSMGRVKYRIIKEINENKDMVEKIRINEEQLKQIVTESVKMVLKEYGRADVKSVGGSPLRYGLSSMFGGKYATRMDRRIKSQKDSEAYRAKREAEAEQERRDRAEAEERNRRYREDADRRNREAAEAERRRGSSIGTSADYDAINRGDYGRVNPNIAYSMWRKGQITQNEYYRVCERNGVQPKY